MYLFVNDFYFGERDYLDFRFFFFPFIAVDVLDRSTQYEKQKQIPQRLQRQNTSESARNTGFIRSVKFDYEKHI